MPGVCMDGQPGGSCSPWERAACACCTLNTNLLACSPPPLLPLCQVYLLGEAARDKEAAKAVQCSLEYTTLRRVTQVGCPAARLGCGAGPAVDPPSTSFAPCNNVPWASPTPASSLASCSLSQPALCLPPPPSAHLPPPARPRQATEIYYDPDPKTTIIEEDQEWVEGYFDLNEGAPCGGW